MTLVPEVLQLSVNSGKKSEKKTSFFYFMIYFLLQFSSNVGANNNSSVNFHCCFFVDFAVFQISFIYSAYYRTAASRLLKLAVIAIIQQPTAQCNNFSQ